MPTKSATPKKPKLTDAERHARFVETAKRLGADKDENALDRALKKVTAPPKAERQGGS